MKNPTRTFLPTLCILLGAAFTAQLGANEPDAQAAPEGLRVGTFDSRLIATAYARSEAFQKRVETMHADLVKAKAAKHKKRISQLEAQGAALQHLIHKQSFSTEPVHDILKTIQDELPGIAKQANVDLIVSKWDVAFQGTNVKPVDVTDLMLAPFHPDEKTNKMLENLRKHAPVPLDQFKGPSK